MLDFAIQQSAFYIKQGGVVIYPTEGLYGISCNCFCDNAIERIIKIKQRSSNKGLIIIADSITRIESLVDLDSLESKLKHNLTQYWPGHNTIILPKKAKVNPLLSGQYDSLAIRITNFEPLRKLIEYVDTPIVSTSANISGNSAINNYQALCDTFKDKVDFIADIACGGAKYSSTIIDGMTGSILRQGQS